MASRPASSFDTEVIRELLLDMAQQRTVQKVLDLVVERLAGQPQVALARIWLVRPGDICARCHMRPECLDQSRCLHLAASNGRSIEGSSSWSRVDGSFQRFPMGIRKVGRIAATGQPVEVEDVFEQSEWIANPEWVKRERIRGFGGQPLVYRGEVLGVLAAFSRTPMSRDHLVWLRMIADHAATAIANTRAFEEIDRLKQQLERENEYLREEVSHHFGDLIGRSAALLRVLEQAELVAPTDTTVLICGESGTGKELIARAIHDRSRRSRRAMVTVNCASIPRELFESEFFGHVRGSFTGAVQDRAGRFQLADEGTLFLDEVGEIPHELQGKLLRVLQEGTFERIGEERTSQANVRVIAATNRDLKQEVSEGRFREDLYYRLSVFPIEVAPLRERLADVPLLAAHFLEEISSRMGKEEPKLRQRHVAALQEYDWPGNVRELRNVIERAVITARAGGMEFDLPAANAAGADHVKLTTALQSPPARILTNDEVKRLESDNVRAALDAAQWKVYGPGGAAALLGMKPTTLASKIRALGLRRQRSQDPE